MPAPENIGGVGRVGLSDKYRALIIDAELSDEIVTFRFSDIAENIEHIQIRPSSDMFKNLYELKSSDFIDITRTEDSAHIKFELNFDLTNWKYPWSIIDFHNEISDLVRSQFMPDLQLKLSDDTLPAFEVILEIINPQIQIIRDYQDLLIRRPGM